MQKNILLVFPGLGKTTLSKRNRSFKDLDFGLFQLEKPMNARLASYVLTTHNLSESGNTVLINDLRGLEGNRKLYGKSDNVQMYIGDPHIIRVRLLERDGSRKGGNFDFVKAIADWRTGARKYNVAVTDIRGKHLAHYFNVEDHRKEVK